MSIEMAKQLQKNIQTKTNARRRNEGRASEQELSLGRTQHRFLFKCISYVIYEMNGNRRQTNA